MMSLASGSSGNCIYIGSDDTHILVDAGISGKKIEEGLNEAGLTGRDIAGILITHEHNDHIRGLGVLARKYGVPIYSTAGTIREIGKMRQLGAMPDGIYRVIAPDCDFGIGDLTILPFSIDHDAADPVAYRVKCGKSSVAVATDMGHYDEYIISHLLDLDAALIEANHDVKMLEAGPYPYPLKRRILGEHGHLSNENSGRLISRILNDRIRHIFLGHLSAQNNYPELAYETVRLEIDESDTPYRADDFPISVAGRNRISELITV